jgi:heme A synthase
MIPFAVVGLLVVVAFLLAWVIISYYRSRESSTDAMLIRIVIGPAVGLLGSALVVPHLQDVDGTVSVVCLTIVAIAALVVIVVKRDSGSHEKTDKQ